MDSLISSQPINEDVSNIECIRRNIEVSIDKLKTAKDVLEYQNHCAILKVLLNNLDEIHMSLGNLRVTQIGKYIAKLESRLPFELSVQAKNLNNKWRDVVLAYRQIVKNNITTRIESGENTIKNTEEKNLKQKITISLLDTELKTVQEPARKQEPTQKQEPTISIQDNELKIDQKLNKKKSTIILTDQSTEHLSQNCYRIFTGSDVDEIKTVMLNTVDKISIIERDVANVKKVILDLNCKLCSIFEKLDQSASLDKAISQQDKMLSPVANLNHKTDLFEITNRNLKSSLPIDVQNVGGNFNYINKDLQASNNKLAVFDKSFNQLNGHSISTQQVLNNVQPAALTHSTQTLSQELNSICSDKINLENNNIDHVNRFNHASKVVIKIEDDEYPVNEIKSVDFSEKTEHCVSKTTCKAFSNQSLCPGPSSPVPSLSLLNSISDQALISKSTMSVNSFPSFLSTESSLPYVTSAHQTPFNSSLLPAKRIFTENNGRYTQLTSPLPLYNSHSHKLNQLNKTQSSSKVIDTKPAEQISAVNKIFNVPAAPTRLQPIIKPANTDAILKTVALSEDTNNVLLEGNLSIQDVELEPFVSFSQAVDYMDDELEREERSYLLDNAKKNRVTWNKLCKDNEGMKYALLVKSNGRMKAAHKASLGKDVIHKIVKSRSSKGKKKKKILKGELKNEKFLKVGLKNENNA